MTRIPDSTASVGFVTSRLVRGVGRRERHDRFLVGRMGPFGLHGTVDLVVGVTDVQHRFSSEADLGDRLVVNGKPEVSELAVALLDAGPADPE